MTEARTLLIGGAWRGAAETFERFDPADLMRSSGHFAAASGDDVEEAYAAAASRSAPTSCGALPTCWRAAWTTRHGA